MAVKFFIVLPCKSSKKKPPKEPLGGSFFWSALGLNHRKVLRWSPPKREFVKPLVFAGLFSDFSTPHCRVTGSPLYGRRLASSPHPPLARLKRLRHLQAFRPAPLPFVSGFWGFSYSPLCSFLAPRLRCFAPAPLVSVCGLQFSRLRRLRHFKPFSRTRPR